MQSVSGHKAIFFSGSKPLAHGHFLSITNAVYMRNAVSDCRSRLSISGSKPLALPGHFLFGLKATGTSWPFLFWAQSHWHFLAISFLGSKPLAHGHFLLLALQMLITDSMPPGTRPFLFLALQMLTTDSMPPGTRPFSFLSITNANYGLNAAWHKAFFFS